MEITDQARCVAKRAIAAVAALAGFALLGACGGPGASDNLSTVDINAAADAAQGSIDTYAANALESAPPTAHRARPRAVVAPVAAVPAVDPDRDAAADVVRRYYAAVGAGAYGDALALQEAAIAPDAFAAGFARYATYRARVGAPGTVDAGAGQRFVTVPVTISGTLKDSDRAFTTTGSVTLHRTGDIDGASEAQRHWRVYRIELAPPPAR